MSPTDSAPAAPLEIVLDTQARPDFIAAVRRHLEQQGLQVELDETSPIHSAGDPAAQIQQRAAIRSQLLPHFANLDVMLYLGGEPDLAATMDWDAWVDLLHFHNLPIWLARDSYRALIVDPATHFNPHPWSGWLGNPHLFWPTSLAEIPPLLDHLIAPIPQEVERKFLLANAPILDAEIYPYKTFELEQVYLDSEPPQELRIRRRFSDHEPVYYLTRKTKLNTGVRLEQEHLISELEWNQHLQTMNADTYPILKHRTNLLYNRQQIELDVYDSIPGLVIAEIEMVTLSATPNPLPPEWEILKEVTDDPNFTNAHLSHYSPLEI